MMFCYQCSAELSTSSQYCRNCGTESLVWDGGNARAWSSNVGYFVLGVIVFAVVFLALSALLASLFPAAGPQLVIVTLGIAASLLAGTCAVLYKRSGSRGRDRRDRGSPTAAPAEIASSQGHYLAEGFPEPPASVTDRTTTELKVR